MNNRDNPDETGESAPAEAVSFDRSDSAQADAGLSSSELAPLPAFKALLARSDRERRRARVEQNLDQLAQALETTEDESASVDAVTALREVLKVWQRLMPKHVVAELAKVVGELAEESQARVSCLYVRRGDWLEVLVGHGDVGAFGREVPFHGRGIVPMVARTGEAYCVGDVARGRDPYYNPQNKETRSEQAVPIVFRNEVLGVLNQESPYPGTFSPASCKALEQRAIRLVRNILTYLAHTSGDQSTACAWNPDFHGWHFRSFLDVILTHLKRELGPAGQAMHFTVWYADPMSETVFALATTGYGKACLRNRTVRLRERTLTGKLALEPDGTVQDCYPNDARMIMPEFDKMMGLRKVRAVTVQSCNKPAHQAGAAAKQPGLVLCLYVFDEEAENWLPDERQFVKMAELLRSQFAAYVDLRPRLSAAQVAQALSECPDSDEQFPEAALAMARVLDAPAVTILARPEKSESLHVVAATTHLIYSPPFNHVPAPPPRERGLVESPYRVDDGSYTGAHAKTPGVLVSQNARGRNNTLPGETLPSWPVHASRKILEYLPKVNGNFRRSLSYGVADEAIGPQPAGGCDHSAQQDASEWALGVFRAIRTGLVSPFTLCDLSVLRDMAGACTDDFRSWQDWFTFASPYGGDVPIRGRISRPIPRSRNRPMPAMAREVLVDVHDLVGEMLGDDCVLQVAVLVEHTGSETMSDAQVLAYHSEVAPTAPRSGERLAADEIRVPELTWNKLLDLGSPKPFLLPSKENQPIEVRAGVRVPFWSWCGRHIQRGVLTVDLTEPKVFCPDLIVGLETASRKIAAIVAAAGSEAARARPIVEADPQAFLAHLRARLDTSSLWLGPTADGNAAGDESAAASSPPAFPWTHGKSLPPEFTEQPDADGSPWVMPMIRARDGAMAVDPDAERWGVFECRTDQADFLRVPLRLGAQTVGVIIAAWDITTAAAEAVASAHIEETAELCRAHRIRDLLALWAIWTWSPRDQWPFRTPFERDVTEDEEFDWTLEQKRRAERPAITPEDVREIMTAPL